MRFREFIRSLVFQNPIGIPKRFFWDFHEGVRGFSE